MALNIPEVLVANITGIVMVLFLLLVRIHHYDHNQTAHRLFNSMLVSTLVALIAESISFLIDGKTFPGSVFLLYLSNTLCTGLTVTVGFFWCGFVNFHIYRSEKHLHRRLIPLGIPLAAIYVLLVINLFGNGILFQIQEGGVYARGKLNGLIYVVLFIYFLESIAEVYLSRQKGASMVFFPVFYFVIPCLVGTIIQGLCYGLATGWLSTAMACVFVDMELEARSSFVDSLSGLFNREYMNYYLSRASRAGASLYGLMIDINDFKSINDRFGHSVGDQAICNMGKILTKSVSDGAIAIRMAGDEFVVFVTDCNEQKLEYQVQAIEASLASFNESGTAPYQLTVSIGSATLSGKTVEQFLTEMDRAMYRVKATFHKS